MCGSMRVAQVKERLVRVWAESAAARAPAQARTFTRNVKDATASCTVYAHAHANEPANEAKRDKRTPSETMAA